MILLSARAGDQARAEGLRAGADDYLVKPFGAAELLARVDGQLALVRLRGEARVATERQRMAEDLHDSVMQEIYGLTLLAEAGRRALASGQHTQVEEYLKQVGESALGTLRELRLLVHALRPHALAQGGLVEALEQRLSAVERRAGIAARLVVKGDLVLAPAGRGSLLLHRAGGPANALKHAAPSEVVVQLTTRGATTTLAVTDNGRGFDPGSVAGHGGLGLAPCANGLAGGSDPRDQTAASGRDAGHGAAADGQPAGDYAGEQVPERGSRRLALAEDIRVLIADDHAVVRFGLRALLASEPGIEVVGEAADGNAAVQQARALQPDVLLLDLLMPGKNGLQVLEEIWPRLPPPSAFSSSPASSKMSRSLRRSRPAPWAIC